MDTLEQLRTQVSALGYRIVQQEPIRDDEPYNSRTVGWMIEAVHETGVGVQVTAPFLQTALERLVGAGNPPRERPRSSLRIFAGGAVGK